MIESITNALPRLRALKDTTRRLVSLTLDVSVHASANETMEWSCYAGSKHYDGYSIDAVLSQAEAALGLRPTEVHEVEMP